MAQDQNIKINEVKYDVPVSFINGNTIVENPNVNRNDNGPTKGM